MCTEQVKKEELGGAFRQSFSGAAAGAAGGPEGNLSVAGGVLSPLGPWVS